MLKSMPLFLFQASHPVLALPCCVPQRSYCLPHFRLRKETIEATSSGCKETRQMPGAAIKTEDRVVPPTLFPAPFRPEGVIFFPRQARKGHWATVRRSFRRVNRGAEFAAGSRSCGSLRYGLEIFANRSNQDWLSALPESSLYHA